MKLKNNPSGVNVRRKRAKIRLLNNLEDNKKKLKDLNDTSENEQRTSHMQDIVNLERDTVRIQNEIGILNGRILPEETAHQRKTKKYRAVR